MADENSAERVRRHRERKALAENDAGMPWLGLVGEEREQAIRDFYGYAASETRTQAERQAAAERIVANPEVVEATKVAERIWAAHGEGADAQAEAARRALRAITGGKSA